MRKAKFWVDWLLDWYLFANNSQTPELYKGNSKVH